MFSSILGLLSFLASAIGTTASIDKSNKEHAAKTEESNYQKKVDRYQKDLLKQREREGRRNALSRAINYDLPTIPQPTPEGPVRPEPVDLSGYDVATGLSNLASAGLNQASGSDTVTNMDNQLALTNAGAGTSDVSNTSGQWYTPDINKSGYDAGINAGSGAPLASVGNKYGKYLGQFRYS